MNSKRVGMTLVELLISLIIAGLVGASIVGFLVVFVTNFQVNADLAEARQRAEMVFTLLGKPVRQAGLGLPVSRDLFDTVFSDDDSFLDDTAFSLLDGGVLDEILETASKDSILYGLYSVPTGYVITEDETPFEDDDGTVSYSINSARGNNTLLDYQEVSSRRWVVFPATRAVFKVESNPSSSHVSLSPRQDGAFSLFDEMHVLRVLEAKVESGDFIMQDPTTNERYGSVEGIVAVRFLFNPTSRVLTAWVLARGGSRQDHIVTKGDVLQWEDEKGDPRHIETGWRYYRLNALSSSWRIRN